MTPEQETVKEELLNVEVTEAQVAMALEFLNKFNYTTTALCALQLAYNKMGDGSFDALYMTLFQTIDMVAEVESTLV